MTEEQKHNFRCFAQDLIPKWKYLDPNLSPMGQDVLIKGLLSRILVYDVWPWYTTWAIPGRQACKHKTGSRLWNTTKIYNYFFLNYMSVRLSGEGAGMWSQSNQQSMPNRYGKKWPYTLCFPQGLPTGGSCTGGAPTAAAEPHGLWTTAGHTLVWFCICILLVSEGVPTWRLPPT